MEQPVFDSAKGLDHRSPIMRSILTMAKPRNCKKRKHKTQQKGTWDVLEILILYCCWMNYVAVAVDKWHALSPGCWHWVCQRTTTDGKIAHNICEAKDASAVWCRLEDASSKLSICPQMDKQFPCPHVCRGSQNAVTMHQSQRAGQHKEPVAAWSVLLGERCQDEVKGWTWPWCCSSTQTLIFFTAQQQLSNGVFLSTKAYDASHMGSEDVASKERRKRIQASIKVVLCLSRVCKLPANQQIQLGSSNFWAITDSHWLEASIRTHTHN